MPGRKSNVSTASVGPEDAAETPPTAADKKASKGKEGLSVDDLSLPKSMVARLAKGVLPANTQIHKDALLALHKSATVFVSYIAANSNDNAQASGKKTVQPQDVMNALKDSEFENFLPRLEAELKKYNEVQCDKRNTYRRKVKEEKAAATSKDGEDGETSELTREGDTTMVTENGSRNGEDSAERPAKKLKGENGTAVQPDADDVDGADADDDQEADDQEDEAEDEVADSEEEQSDDDQPMEDALEEQEDDERSGMRDEALDDPDSD